jgi:hypothetical protein
VTDQTVSGGSVSGSYFFRWSNEKLFWQMGMQKIPSQSFVVMQQQARPVMEKFSLLPANELIRGRTTETGEIAL